MIHWTNEEIIALDEPYLNLPFLKEVRREFEPTLEQFKDATKKNPNLFPVPLTS